MSIQNKIKTQYFTLHSIRIRIFLKHVNNIQQEASQISYFELK